MKVIKIVTMFVNMNSVSAQSKKIYNSGYKKKERVKVYARVQKKDSTMVSDWLESFYDEY